MHFLNGLNTEQKKNENCMLQGNPCNKTPTDHP